MSTAIFGRGQPWTEEDYLALGETPDRVELLDGSLLVSPNPSLRHQHIRVEIERALGGGALHALGVINVRLRPNRIAIPDLVLTGPVDFDAPVINADAVHLVGEVLSPNSAATDEVLKMHYYAAAGIPWYLLVEQETGALHLYRLSGDTYVEHSSARPGAVLVLKDPVEAAIRPEDLLPPG
ncbi:Uma2 family endonuclease [Krasilnikovia sp. MM14-A1004]|uniref:Uma2 family endonuclease n=1 Tax=Krasilnikovia sp. MM14-A1004 TaxID=3373541 RepID=UPI00399C7380